MRQRRSLRVRVISVVSSIAIVSMATCSSAVAVADYQDLDLDAGSVVKETIQEDEEASQSGAGEQEEQEPEQELEQDSEDSQEEAETDPSLDLNPEELEDFEEVANETPIARTTQIAVSPGKFINASAVARGVTRAGGQDRYDTSIAVSKRLFPGSSTAQNVFVASGMSYPDGLTLGALAAYAGGPLLLTPTKKPNAKIIAEVKRLRPETIYIAGGTGAVGKAVEQQLSAIAPRVVRLGGKDRYDTSAAIAAMFPVGTPAMISTGANYPDALVAGAASGKVGPSGAAVILSQGFKSTAKLTSTLKRLKPSSVNIVGGTWSGTSQSQIKAAAGVGSLRIMAGSDRYDTSAKVAQTFWKTPSSTVLYASGSGYADSLTAVPAAKAYGAPLLLTKKSCRPKVMATAGSKQGHVLLIGGSGVISDGSARTTCPILPPKVTLNSSGTYSFNMSHQAQINGYYCGPATATMIMSRLGYTKSVHGVPLNQSNIAGGRYLNTTTAGTRWLLASMSNGMNNWMGKNLYRQQASPNAQQLKTAVANSVTKTGRPVVIDAQEYAWGPHYNSHPLTSTIDHLMPINSYNARTGTITVLDSAAHFYTGAKKEFSHNLANFTQFAQRFGMYY